MRVAFDMHEDAVRILALRQVSYNVQSQLHVAEPLPCPMRSSCTSMRT